MQVSKTNLLTFSLIFLSCLTIYALTLSTNVHLEDDGAFILAAYSQGIAHPPGYPIYTLIGHIFTLFDISTVAARVHFMSAFFGALTVLNLTIISWLLTRSLLASATASLIVAFSEIFWSQSIIAEVYTLNTALFTACFLIALIWHQHVETMSFRQKAALLSILAFTFSLGLSNHWPLMVLASPGLLFVLRKQPLTILKLMPFAILGFFVGLTPYLWMFFRGDDAGVIIAFGEITNFKELLYYISREGYAGVDNESFAGFEDKINFYGFFLDLLYANFGFAPLMLAAIGLANIKRKTIIITSLLFIILLSTLALCLLLGFEYTGFKKLTFRVYPLLSFCFLAPLIAIGIKTLIDIIHKQKTGQAVKHLTVLLITVMPLLYCIKNFTLVDNSADTWASDFATGITESLPARSVLVASTDVDTGPMAYTHLVENNHGKGITLVHHFGALYPNRKVHPYDAADARLETMTAFYGAQEQVFFSSKPPYQDVTNHGVLYGYGNTASFDSNFEALRINILKSIAFNSARPLSWQNIHKSNLSGQLLQYYVNNNRFNELSDSDLHNLLSHFDTAILYLGSLMDDMERNKQTIPVMIDHCNSLKQHSLGSHNLYLLAYYRALYLLEFELEKNHELILSLLEEALEHYPSNKNKALPYLLTQYQLLGESDKIEKLKKQLKLDIH